MPFGFEQRVSLPTECRFNKHRSVPEGPLRKIVAVHGGGVWLTFFGGARQQFGAIADAEKTVPDPFELPAPATIRERLRFFDRFSWR